MVHLIRKMDRSDYPLLSESMIHAKIPPIGQETPPAGEQRGKRAPVDHPFTKAHIPVLPRRTEDDKDCLGILQ